MCQTTVSPMTAAVGGGKARLQYRYIAAVALADTARLWNRLCVYTQITRRCRPLQPIVSVRSVSLSALVHVMPAAAAGNDGDDDERWWWWYGDKFGAVRAIRWRKPKNIWNIFSCAAYALMSYDVSCLCNFTGDCKSPNFTMWCSSGWVRPLLTHQYRVSRRNVRYEPFHNK